MTITIDKTTLSEIRSKLDEVSSASTKADATQAIKHLDHIASQLKGQLDSYLSGKLSEVISYAKEASGQAKDKQLWISNMESSWYVFENGFEKSINAEKLTQ